MFSSVESLSCVQLFLTPWTAACQASLSITNSWNFLRLMSFELLMPSNHLILCPLLLLLSIFPSIKFFSNESALCGQRIGTSASASVLPMNIQDWLIFFFFKIDLFDLLAVQRTLKSLLQHHSSKASIFWHSAFFIVQLSHPYMTTGKTIALTIRTNGKVMSLLFKMLSKFVIPFLSRSKCLLISWLQSPSAVILEPKKIKSITVSIVSPLICHKGMGSDAMIFIFWMLSLSQLFHSPLSHSSKGSLVPLCFLP